MTPRAWLGVWLLAVCAVTLVHQPGWLAAALGTALLVSGRGRGRLLLKSGRVVLPVLVVISGGYLVLAALTGTLVWAYLLLFNLRVLLLAVLTTWAVRDIDLHAALRDFPAAQRWLSIVRSQVDVFRRLAADSREAVQSRSTIPPKLAQRYRAGAALGLAALDKAVYNSESLTQGMRSRGALDE